MLRPYTMRKTSLLFEFFKKLKCYLGFEFAAEVKRTIKRIIQYPDAWAKLSKRTHRCRTNRFPYGIIYQIRENTLLIVGIMHLSRDPQSWKSRLKEEEI